MVESSELLYQLKHDKDISCVLENIKRFKHDITRRVDLQAKDITIAGGAIASKILHQKNKADIDVFINTIFAGKKIQNEELEKIGKTFFTGEFSLLPFGNEFYRKFHVLEGKVDGVPQKVQLIIGNGVNFDLALSDIFLDDNWNLTGKGLNLFCIFPMGNIGPQTLNRIVKYIDRGAPVWNKIQEYFLKELASKLDLPRGLTPGISLPDFGNMALYQALWKNDGFFKLLGLSLPVLECYPEQQKIFMEVLTPVEIVKARISAETWNPKPQWIQVSKKQTLWCGGGHAYNILNPSKLYDLPF